MHTETSKALSIVTVLASAAYGIVVATGVLAIGFVTTATIKGFSPVDFYAETFPSFRGPGLTQLPPAVYAIFFLYVIGAIEIAILCRHRLSKRWSR